MSSPEPFDPTPHTDQEQAEARIALAMDRLRRSMEPLHRIDPALERRVFALHASLGGILDALRDRR